MLLENILFFVLKKKRFLIIINVFLFIFIFLFRRIENYLHQTIPKLVIFFNKFKHHHPWWNSEYTTHGFPFILKEERGKSINFWEDIKKMKNIGNNKSSIGIWILFKKESAAAVFYSFVAHCGRFYMV